MAEKEDFCHPESQQKPAVVWQMPFWRKKGQKSTIEVLSKEMRIWK